MSFVTTKIEALRRRHFLLLNFELIFLFHIFHIFFANFLCVFAQIFISYLTLEDTILKLENLTRCIIYISEISRLASQNWLQDPRPQHIHEFYDIILAVTYAVSDLNKTNDITWLFCCHTLLKYTLVNWCWFIL